MLFRPELVTAILAGVKTQTRRPDGGWDCRYKVGRTYAVQPGRGKAAVARIRVTAVRGETLGEITEADAQREGFPSRQAFADYWERLWGDVRWDLPVFVIDFELREGECMKRFIDLRGQILLDDESPHFAWFNTVVDRFEEWSGSQEWNSWADFARDYEGDELERYRRLCPSWLTTEDPDGTTA